MLQARELLAATEIHGHDVGALVLLNVGAIALFRLALGLVVLGRIVSGRNVIVADGLELEPEIDRRIDEGSDRGERDGQGSNPRR